jgi:hypothetical protein
MVGTFPDSRFAVNSPILSNIEPDEVEDEAED